MLAWRRWIVPSRVGGVRLESISVCLTPLSLSDCPVPFSELDLDVADLREGVDEVVAFVCT
jgi:hypothetical protein